MDSTFLIRSKISGIRFSKRQIRAIHGTCYEGVWELISTLLTSVPFMAVA